MKPSKDYEYLMKTDPCQLCVCCDNQYVEGEDYPCAICHNFSEFIPAEGDVPSETNWLNNIIEYKEALDLIDEVTDKIHQLDAVMPDIAILYHADGFLNYLKFVKNSSAESWMFGPDDFGGPCYDGGLLVNCDECSKTTCPYRGR